MRSNKTHWDGREGEKFVGSVLSASNRFYFFSPETMLVFQIVPKSSLGHESTVTVYCCTDYLVIVAPVSGWEILDSK